MEPHVQRHFTQVGHTVDRPEVLDLMQALTISQIPVIDTRGRLIGLHTLRGIIGTTPRPNWAVVMAGGRGERLRPLTDSIPKPMVKVAGRPILERIVLHLVGCGIRTIFISVNYMADVIEEHFCDGASFGCSIEYLRERMPLGTGGSLSLLPQMPSHPTLVLNGDLVTQFDVTRMLAFHDEGGYRATVGIHEYSHTVPLGVVEIEGDRVIQIREKPTQTWRVNAGIYVLAPELLQRVPPDTYFDLPALVEECLESGEAVGAFHVREDWVDVGHHRELKRARGEG
jgi:NDP-sugar pyrophosphorylase family protein